MQLAAGHPCADEFTDPSGDTFETGSSSGLTIPDVVAIRASADATNLAVQIEFQEEHVSDWTAETNSVTGFLDLDTDQDSQTGIASIVDDFGGSTGMGVDFYVDIFALDAQDTFGIYDENFDQVGSLVPVFSGKTLTMVIPLSDIGGDDGTVSMATVVGTDPEATDIAPNAGNYSNAAPGATARPGKTSPQRRPSDPRKWKRQR